MAEPENNIEKLFITVIMIITTGVFGYVINNLGSILEDMQKYDKTYRK